MPNGAGPSPSPGQRWWEALFSGEERQVYGAYQPAPAEQPPPGERRPALLVVDVTRAFCGEPGQTLAEAVREWPPAYEGLTRRPFRLEERVRLYHGSRLVWP